MAFWFKRHRRTTQLSLVVFAVGMIVFAAIAFIIVVVVAFAFEPFFDGDEISVLAFNCFLKLYYGSDEELNIEFVQICVWNAVWISRDKLDR